MELPSLTIDTATTICKLNGIDISKHTHELHLDFKDGVWSLVIMQTKTYTSGK